MAVFSKKEYLTGIAIMVTSLVFNLIRSELIVFTILICALIIFWIIFSISYQTLDKVENDEKNKYSLLLIFFKFYGLACIKILSIIFLNVFDENFIDVSFKIQNIVLDSLFSIALIINFFIFSKTSLFGKFYKILFKVTIAVTFFLNLFVMLAEISNVILIKKNLEYQKSIKELEILFQELNKKDCFVLGEIIKVEFQGEGIKFILYDRSDKIVFSKNILEFEDEIHIAKKERKIILNNYVGKYLIYNGTSPAFWNKQEFNERANLLNFNQVYFKVVNSGEDICHASKKSFEILREKFKTDEKIRGTQKEFNYYIDNSFAGKFLKFFYGQNNSLPQKK